MAIIQIPIGGRPVTVDVPDFAMESTQQDVKNAIQDLVTTMGGVVSKIDDTSSGDMAIKGAVDDLNGITRVNLSGCKSIMRYGVACAVDGPLSANLD